MRDRPEAWLGRGEPAHARGGGAGSWVNWSMRRTEGRGLGGAGEGVGRCQAAGRGWRMRRADGCGLGGVNACAERWGGVGWGWRMRRPKAGRCAGAVGACAVGKTREGGAAHVRYRGGGGRGCACAVPCEAPLALWPPPWAPGPRPGPGPSGCGPSPRPPRVSAPTTAPSTATRCWRAICYASCPATGYGHGPPYGGTGIAACLGPLATGPAPSRDHCNGTGTPCTVPTPARPRGPSLSSGLPLSAPSPLGVPRYLGVPLGVSRSHLGTTLRLSSPTWRSLVPPRGHLLSPKSPVGVPSRTQGPPFGSPVPPGGHP